MEAPLFGVYAAVLQQAFDVVEEPTDEVDAGTGKSTQPPGSPLRNPPAKGERPGF